MVRTISQLATELSQRDAVCRFAFAAPRVLLACPEIRLSIEPISTGFLTEGKFNPINTKNPGINPGFFAIGFRPSSFLKKIR